MITLRTATIDDLDLIRRWDDEPHVIESDPNMGEWDWARELQFFPPWREQLIAEHDGRPIGVLQIIDPLLEETHYWGECEPNLRAIDIWIGEEEDLGKGYGSIMMDLALQRCFAPLEVTAVLIDPLARNLRARKFYERMGFRFLEDRVFNDDDCAVYRITRDQWLEATNRASLAPSAAPAASS